MTAALQAALVAKGFEEHNTGGGCIAFVRYRNGHTVTDVITTSDLGLPDPNDWLLCSYAGDWRADDCGDPVECLDDESSPVSLLEAVDLLTEGATCATGCTDTGRGVCADCGNPTGKYA